MSLFAKHKSATVTLECLYSTFVVRRLNEGFLSSLLRRHSTSWSLPREDVYGATTVTSRSRSHSSNNDNPPHYIRVR